MKGSPEVYRPRRFASLSPWTFGARRFKVIGISHRLNEEPFAADPATIAAARGFVEGLQSEMDDIGAHFDLGYVVLHQGEAANWLLFDWWIEGGIACQILGRSASDQPTLFEREARPLMACVWEAIALAQERNAWVETMMGDRPDPDAYMDRRMLAGVR